MTIECVRANSTVTISITGRFDFESMYDFRDAYCDSKTSTKRYVIDLSKTEHLDSSALGMLLHMRRDVGEEVPIKITNCKPSIKHLLSISRFDKKFKLD